MGWSCLTPIDTAVHSRGIVILQRNPISIVSGIAGRIRDIHIQAGAHVKAGTLLLQLDPHHLLAKKRSLETQIHYAELYRSAHPHAGLAVLYADLEQTRLDLDRLTIASPVTGRIGWLADIRAGDIIAAGATFATVV